MNGASMKNCFNFNNVAASGTDDNVGGLVGYATGVTFGGENTADRVGNYGNVSATNSSTSNVGGLVGYMNGGSIKYAFNIGNIMGDSIIEVEGVATTSESGGVGGLVGTAKNETTIDNVYNYGKLIGTGKIAPIVGLYYGFGHTISTVYNFNGGEVKLAYYNPAYNNPTDAEIVISVAFAFAISGGATANETQRQILNWTSQTLEEPTTDEDGITHITTAEQLAYVSKNIANYANANIDLDADIDLTGYIWAPIGDETTPFSGTFNGNGKTITGMAAFDEDAAGLFGSVYKEESETQTFEDVIFKNCVSQSWSNASTLIGYLVGNQTINIESITLENARSCGKNEMIENSIFLATPNFFGKWFSINGYNITITEDESTDNQYTYEVAYIWFEGWTMHIETLEEGENINATYFAKGVYFKCEKSYDLRITIDDFTAENPEATFEFMYKTN